MKKIRKKTSKIILKVFLDYFKKNIHFTQLIEEKENEKVKNELGCYFSFDYNYTVNNSTFELFRNDLKCLDFNNSIIFKNIKILEEFKKSKKILNNIFVLSQETGETYSKTMLTLILELKEHHYSYLFKLMEQEGFFSEFNNICKFFLG